MAQDRYGVATLCRHCFAYGYVSSGSAFTHCPDCGHDRLICHPELLELHLAHIDCDAFYCAVEKRDNPELRDKPVIVGGGERGVVAAACYVARQYGIRSAMPSWQARKACPELIVIKPRMSHYQAVSRQIKSRMLALTPLVQSLSIDEAFVDMAGTEKLHGRPAAVMLAAFQRQIAEEIGITVSVGLAPNKSLAKIASDQDKPDGFFVLGGAEAKGWLADQPVSILFGLGKAATARLEAQNITSCRDIQQASPHQLRQILGKDADRIAQLASGIDPRQVIPHQPAKSVSAETTFNADETQLDAMLVIAEQQSHRVAKNLKQKGLSGRTITLKLKTSSHKIRTRSISLSQPTQMAFRIFDAVSQLLHKEIDGRTAWRLLGVGVEISDSPEEASLFGVDNDASLKQEKLERALDALSDKLGDVPVTSGRQFQKKNHRPSPKQK